MAIVVADTGAEAILDVEFNDARPAGGNNLTAKLFINDVTPTDASTAATFTEAVGGGYASKTLTNGSWTVSTVGGIAQAAYAEQVWTFTGALTADATVYGYFVVDADGVLRWAEKFTTPCTPVADGNHIDITITYQASKGTPS